MTTILAIRSKNSVIMCADSRETGQTWQYAFKLTKVSPYLVLGCAGHTAYISLLKKCVKEEFSKRGQRDCLTTISDAGDAFAERVAQSCDRAGLPSVLDRDIRELLPEGILAGYDENDKEFYIFKVDPPFPPQQVGYPYEDTIGGYPFRGTTGSGGLAADILLKTVEFLLSKIGLNWVDLSDSLVAQFCFTLMQRVTYVDSYTSGLSAYRLDKFGYHPLTAKDVFGAMGKGDHYARVLMDSAIGEIGLERLADLANDYRFGELILKLKPLLHDVLSNPR